MRVPYVLPFDREPFHSKFLIPYVAASFWQDPVAYGSISYPVRSCLCGLYPQHLIGMALPLDPLTILPRSLAPRALCRAPAGRPRGELREMGRSRTDRHAHARAGEVAALAAAAAQQGASLFARADHSRAALRCKCMQVRPQ